ncbi:MAG: nucleotidyltransferase [Parcubacteria group bacterium Gr01-1014_18]|nr:MAG: nucleotidyltransferase [Parcubacteria group bacterium Greene0416_36]TSC79324.1 MAG: nucleotidyltransferase [Parcubacteria group bacterium Gr01-1014_18]TSD05947.1 MAG: nucleotidyltransferase [Parcubacteria group bacterium Greene0714_2]
MFILTPKQNEKIREIAQKYDLDLLLLFGSQATGKTRKDSDFDVAFYGGRRLEFREECQMITELMAVFKTHQVDLVNLRTAKPLILAAIFDKCQILFEGTRRPLLFDHMRAFAFHQYVETKPLYQYRFEKLKKSLNI